MKIATTINEVFDYVDHDPVKAVEFYKDTGFRYLDYSFYRMLTTPNHPLMGEDWKGVATSVKRTADALGFTFVQAHLPACKIVGEGKEAGLNACLRALEACKIFGIKLAVIHSSLREGEYRYPEDKDAYFEANRPFFRALIPAMEKSGVNVLLENSCTANTRGLYFPITGQDLNDMVAYLDHPMFGAIWDIGHAHIQGLDQHDEMVTLGKNLKAIHVHDNNGKHDLHQRVFDGSLDWDSFLRGIQDSGFQGAFTYEIDGHVPYCNDKNEVLKRLRAEEKRKALTLHYDLAKNLLQAYGIEGE